MAEIMAAQDYDALTIDCQHGFVSYDSATGMLQAMRASSVVPMVRVPWLDPDDIMKALDAGAHGIICPMINNRSEAERLVSYMRYPPMGYAALGRRAHCLRQGKTKANMLTRKRWPLP